MGSGGWRQQKCTHPFHPPLPTQPHLCTKHCHRSNGVPMSFMTKPVQRKWLDSTTTAAARGGRGLHGPMVCRRNSQRSIPGEPRLKHFGWAESAADPCCCAVPQPSLRWAWPTQPTLRRLYSSRIQLRLLVPGAWMGKSWRQSCPLCNLRNVNAGLNRPLHPRQVTPAVLDPKGRARQP
jgi:hypothetical protein